MNSIRSCIRGGDAEAVRLWHQVCDEMETAQARWIAELRAAGVKAAHPDDGWVDREHNTLQFAYPQFNDDAKVGDLVALGWHPSEHRPLQHRIVRLTGFTAGLLGMGCWSFEPA
jgi:hypothetical protein